MKQDNISVWVKAMIVCACIMAAIAYAVVMPMCAEAVVNEYPEFSGWKMPWYVFLGATAIPIIAAAVYAWKIAVNVGNDNSFSSDNARYLRIIAALAAFDAAFLFMGNVILLLCGMNHPGVVLISLAPALIGIIISVAAAALSHLAGKANEIQEENKLTI